MEQSLTSSLSGTSDMAIHANMLASLTGNKLDRGKRADLDLHINLLAEHELTKLSEVVLAIAARLDVRVGR